MKVNRNFFWAETFVNELVQLGIKYACISPGSRNTPLTLAFAYNKKIKKYIHIDERSCGFFALGLAKVTNTPVAIVCTSGTATAEFYPAIIEAYKQRIPLIVCTADRPPELLNRGANQAINQNNLYKNHIRWFFDVGLPELTDKKIKRIKTVTHRAVAESRDKSRGPVHLNFPFRKPFEPGTYTDDVPQNLLKLFNQETLSNKNLLKKSEKNLLGDKWFYTIIKQLTKFEKGLIIAGPENYEKHFCNDCLQLAEKLKYPVIADGASQLRFGPHDKSNIISNFDAFLRSGNFSKKFKPDVILHFGRTITSKALENYLEQCNAKRYLVNEYGDWFDPSNKSDAAFACKPFDFSRRVIKHLDKINFNRDKGTWRKIFNNADKIADDQKQNVIFKSRFPNEPRVISELLKIIPSGAQIMISNSMPIRDFDYFASNSEKEIIVYNNRGASGIDGITSTALGIAAAGNAPTVLLTGDLAFYHDMNGLLAAKKYKIPLTVILINNNGGGIFEVLPVSKYRKVFKEYFITPHKLNFSNFVKSYNGNYIKIISWKHFRESLKKSFKRKNFSVLEIKTDAVKSLELRKKYWNETDRKIADVIKSF